ncbi:single-stranded DNA-binding protein [Macrococcoides goetzii]|uniref:Single-stranded DNA-binding protein n=1 Tax=Macrococcoides goetzii TaxID=1891097 RepID=A0A2G5NUN7_9STAP|nr:ERF family protein [Macrococcus goetzii]RAI79698.1 single-stranded DNA-binding protein [Macrococcus goetzii]
MNKSESIVEISKALAEFQEKVKQPLKDANNPFFKSKYVPLENVVESITEIAPRLGLSFTQWALNDTNGRIGVATMLMHSSGEYIEFDPVFMKADKETAQGAGALITYLKRYSLSAVFGITSDQDDDGNAASGNKKLATAQEVGQLKANIMKFAKQNNGEASIVQESLKIKDYTKMTSEQVAFAQKTLNEWGLKHD